ncbi:serine/threonine-protein phosphatase [Streptomyces sp. SID8374]|uniref:protein phosphatase 2C domain-containing protein n=1 Tax=Streptomyces sp. SID8374 TaxID=2690354 RepID=UPI00136BC73E|nr:protein phosphatase 2C domain-containing protein [Streptomyces sp. SID8374]MYX13745.1 serine/threonine-protein phosphatase [Streptomyces sp. SID8374]
MSESHQQPALARCPGCEEPPASGDLFCGACGYDLTAVPARPDDRPTMAITVPPAGAPGAAAPTGGPSAPAAPPSAPPAAPDAPAPPVAAVEWPAASSTDSSDVPAPVHRPTDLPGTDSGGTPLPTTPPAYEGGQAVTSPVGHDGQAPTPPVRHDDRAADPGRHDDRAASAGQAAEEPAGAPAAGPAVTPAASPPAESPDSSGDFALAAPDPRTAEPTPTPAAGTKVCVACRSGRVDPDGYCENCGHAQPRERDHMEQELGSVAAVSDRGLRHHRNEDSFAVSSTALPDGSPAVVAIVCDGVSSASRPDEASAAAASAANEALLESLPRGTHPQQAMHEAIVAASEAVNALAQDPPGAAEHEAHRHQNAPACTLVGAIMAGGLLVVGWVGDSRVYWVPDDRTGPPARLTEDDSWAAQMVAAGLMTEAEAYADERAHAITGWLGADSYELEPHTASFKPDRPGLVVVCTDGLWNYAESAEEMAAAVPPEAHRRPLHGAQVLVGHALDGGGHDNVTVALLPFAVEPQGAGSACTTV